MPFRYNAISGQLDYVVTADALVFDTNSGSATSSDGVIDLVGGTGISVSGSGSTLTVTYIGGGDGTIPTQFLTDSGTATTTNNIIAIKGISAQGVTTSSSGNQVFVNVNSATTSTKGVASFDSDDFTVSGAGKVSLSGSVFSQLTLNSGIITPSFGNINLLGSSPIVTTGTAAATATISINNASTSSKGAASFSSVNFNVTAGHVEVAPNGIDDTEIRLANNSYLRARNAAGSADVNLLKVNASNNGEFGVNIVTLSKSGAVGYECITTNASNAYLRSYSAGGDSFLSVNDSSGNVGYAFGIDGNDSSTLKLTYGTTSQSPSSGTVALLHDNGTGFFQFNEQVRMDGEAAIRFYDSDSSNYIGFKGDATITSDVTYTLPEDGNNGDILATDGAGGLTFNNPTSVLPSLFFQWNSTFSGSATLPYMQFMNDDQDQLFLYTGGSINFNNLGVAGGLAQSANLTGTISAAGTAVTGSGTSFTTDFQVGDVIYSVTDATARRITVVTDNTNLTVESSWTITGGTSFRRGGRAQNTAYLVYAIYNGSALNILAHTRNVWAGHTFPAADLPSGYTIQRQIPRFIPTENASTSVAGNHCGHGQILFTRSGLWNNPSITEFLTAGTATSPTEVQMYQIPAGSRNAWLGWKITNSASPSGFQIRTSGGGVDQSTQITGVTDDIGLVLVRLNDSGNVWYYRTGGSGELTLNVNAVEMCDYHMPT